MLLSAALCGASGRVAPIQSHAMWQKETAILELKMERWSVSRQGAAAGALPLPQQGCSRRASLPLAAAAADQPDEAHALRRGLAGAVRGARHCDGRTLPRGLHAREGGGDASLHSMELEQKVRWVRDTWKWNWAAVDGDGEPIKERVMISPGSK
eukprot:2996721-Prymnesium_polylepis.1